MTVIYNVCLMALPPTGLIYKRCATAALVPACSPGNRRREGGAIFMREPLLPAADGAVPGQRRGSLQELKPEHGQQEQEQEQEQGQPTAGMVRSEEPEKEQSAPRSGCVRVLSWVGCSVGLGAIPALAIAALSSGATVAEPLVENDAVVLGILLLVMGLVFNIEETAKHSSNRCFRRTFEVLPPIMFCYFIPGLLATANVFATDSGLPNASRNRHEACRCQLASDGGPDDPPSTCQGEEQGGDAFCAAAALDASPADNGRVGWPLCDGLSGCIIVQSYQGSAVPGIAQDILLPACLVLLTLSIDIPGVIKLGPQAVGIFLGEFEPPTVVGSAGKDL